MEICVLASGSSGNATFVSDDETSVLVDAGISFRKISKLLGQIGKDVHELDAVLVTHEHTDHIKGLTKISKHTQVPVFMNELTQEKTGIKASVFVGDFKINTLDISPKRVDHDAIDPVGYEIRNGKAVGVFTDFGRPNKAIINTMQHADAMVIESNHDVDMLIKGPYPAHLKQRILSSRGHISNIEASMLVQNYSSENLKHVFLGHLSRTNNNPDRARDAYKTLVSKKIDATVCEQFEMTQVIRI